MRRSVSWSGSSPLKRSQGLERLRKRRRVPTRNAKVRQSMLAASDQVDIGIGAAHEQQRPTGLQTRINLRGHDKAYKGILERDQVGVGGKQDPWQTLQRDRRRPEKRHTRP